MSTATTPRTTMTPGAVAPSGAAARARHFTGAALKEIAFPLGGIGTGTISLGGRGQLRDWEIFNRPAKGCDLPLCFFSIWARPDGGDAVARILERRLLPPFVGDRGLSPWAASALPRLEEATFVGTYPTATIRFHDSSLPVEAELEAFTPFVPLDDRVSGLPVAVFLWRLRNPSRRAVDVTLAYTQMNPVGYDGVTVLPRGRRQAMFGGNVNEWTDEHGIRGLRMSRPGFDPTHPGAGTVAVATTWRDVTFSEHWERSGWFDDIQNFWDDFRADGRLPDRAEGTPSPAGETDAGTLGLRARIGPGETVELPVVLAWHFPSLVNYWGPFETLPGQSVVGGRMTNWFATQWPDAWAAATETLERLPDLTARTRTFRDALFDSTLPPEVLDAVSSQMSIIRTTTCLRTADGRFHAFEGCDDNAGCCPMNCTHVWNYAQALAFLFPQLERSVRLTDYQYNTLPDGEQKFRTMLPLQTGVLWNYVAAADGQMGTLMKLYREWLVSGDDAYLRSLWPQAKKTLAYAWQLWDPDRDGVMEGEQHNTYDIEFYGPNTMCGALYLGALRAAEEMARHLGDPDAAEYARIYASRPCPLRPRALERRVLRAARADAGAPRGAEGQVPAAASAGDPPGRDHPPLPVRPGLPGRPAPRPVVRPRGRARPPPARGSRPHGGPLDLPAQLPARRWSTTRAASAPTPSTRRRPSSSARGLAAAARNIPSPTRTSAGPGSSTPSRASSCTRARSTTAWRSSAPCGTATTACGATPGTSSSAATTTRAPSHRGRSCWRSRATSTAPPPAGSASPRASTCRSSAACSPRERRGARSASPRGRRWCRSRPAS